MTAQPEFLVRLGLAPDADERQVRRAYARELKLIDQERDLEGFQNLRACYEAALAWAARIESAPERAVIGAPSQDEPAPADTQADARPIPEGEEPVNPGVLGNDVFADFCTRVEVLAAQGEQNGGDETGLTAPWTAALREALADQRLLHLYARVLFEHRVAALLADGWRAGHHLLLPAAIGVFDWDRDRSALARLGRAGGVLDAALEQRAMFLSQDVRTLKAHREVLSRLRRGALDKRTLRNHSTHLMTLMNRFPTLLAIVAPYEAAAAWRKRCTDKILSSPEPGAAASAQPWWLKFSSGWRAAFVVFLLVRLIATFGTHDTPQPRTSDVQQRERLRHPKPIYEDEPVTAERIAAIRKGISYLPGADVPSGTQAAEFKVFLDADGSVLGMNKLKIPGDPAFAIAVEKAIRASGPFPPKTAKVFTIGFDANVVRVPDASMAKIRRSIHYRLGKNAPPGEQHVQFRVTLDAAGGIIGIKVEKMPADAAFAHAVEHAIRATAPFPPETPRSFSVEFHTAPRKPAGAN
jgi:protein TonB